MIDPRGMRNAREWVDFVTQPLQALGASPRRLDRSENWALWAFNIIQSGVIAHFNPPDPRYFDDWVSWAERFNQAVPY